MGVSLLARAGAWDRGLDYRQAYRHLLSLYNEYKGKGRYTQACYAATLLVQLRNGCRISEAVDAVLAMASSRAREAEVRVRKRRDGATRLCVLPKELKPRDLAPCIGILDPPEKAVARLKVWALERLGFNTHSLRYAFITELLRRGVNPSIVAKMTGHARLDYILRYTQRKQAEDLLRDL